MTSYIFLLLTGLLTAVSNVIIRNEMKSQPEQSISIAQKLIYTVSNYKIILGLLTLGIAFIFYTLALSKIKLNIAYPIMTGTTVLLITIFQVTLLKESINIFEIIGIITILLGISLIMGFGK